MTAANASAGKAPGLIALLWVMMKRMAVLMVTPGSNKSIKGLWAEIEHALTDMLFEQLKHIDASFLGLDPADFDIALIWTKSGHLDFDIQPKPHAIAKLRANARASWLTFIAQRRRARQLHRARTLIGAGFPRHGAVRSRMRFERRNAARRRLSTSIIAAAAPQIAPTPVCAPP
jgi:hypothetical protein